MRSAGILAAWLWLCAGGAMAQTQSQLTGTVTDNSGAVVVGATVGMRNTDTGVTLNAVTNPSGIYNFPFLQPGPYEISCELAGFKKFVRGGLVLETGSARTVDIQLEVGAVTETVVVTASTPMLESESSTVGQLIERAAVANMPVESRRVAALVRLMGGVVYREEVQGEAIPRFAMGGGRSSNQMWNLDGAVVQNMSLGVPILTLNPPAESLQEFRAETNNYSAEFGRAGGGLILMTTRSGTNAFHGSAYEFLRNDKLDARTFFAPKKAPLRYNIFGASFSGPFSRDRTFFFFHYEGARRRDALTFADSDVPHPAEVNGDFSARRDLRLLDPVSREPFPNNTIPASRIDPMGQAFARFYPAPNIPNNDITRAPLDNYVANVSDKLAQNFITARLDHVFNPSNRMYARFNYMVSYTTWSNVFPNRFADFRAQMQDNDNTSIMGNWIRNVRPTLINELRLNYGNRSNVVRAAGTGSGKNGELKLAGVRAEDFPRVNVTGLTSLGTGSHQRLQLPILTKQIIDAVTWIKGRHQVKAGFEFRYSMNKDVNWPTSGGQFGFGNRATGSGLAELLLGWTNSGASNTTEVIASRSDFWGAFVQDDFKVTGKLTLNAGIRWDLDTPRWEQNNRQSGFDGKAINPVAGVPGVITFSGRDGRSKYAHDMDKNNVGPRFGLAYRFASNTVVRAGYGISYLGAYVVAVPFILTNGFGQNILVESPDGGFTPAFLFRNGLPSVPREELGPGYGAVKLGSTPRTATGYFQQKHLNGYAQQWNLTLQRVLRGNLLAELAYQGNVGRKLGGTSIDMNEIPLVDGRGPARQDQRLRRFPQFSSVTWYSPVWGDSSYHSLNLKLEKRYSGGLTFLSNFPGSKFLDNVGGGNELGGPAGSGYTHSELHGLDKSYAGNDLRRRWVSSAVYELPFGRERHWKIANRMGEAVLGGWGLSLIAELRDGVPYGVIEQTNVTNAFSSSQRPNLLQNPKIGGGRSRAEMVARYFDTGAFQAPGVGVFGNAARTVGFGPGFVGVDTSIHKRWRLREGASFLFRTDFFNFPNRPNFASPNTQRGRADFGRISAVLVGSSGRLLQLSLRVEF